MKTSVKMCKKNKSKDVVYVSKYAMWKCWWSETLGWKKDNESYKWGECLEDLDASAQEAKPEVQQKRMLRLSLRVRRMDKIRNGSITADRNSQADWRMRWRRKVEMLLSCAGRRHRLNDVDSWTRDKETVTEDVETVGLTVKKVPGRMRWRQNIYKCKLFTRVGE